MEHENSCDEVGPASPLFWIWNRGCDSNVLRLFWNCDSFPRPMAPSLRPGIEDRHLH